MTSAPQTAFVDKPPIELPHPVRMRILFMVMIGVFLAALDQTVVGTALPRIITDLGGNDLYTWAFTAYLLTSTISGPLYGKLSDLFGRRPIFLFGIGIFMVGSLLAGLSQEMWHLIGATPRGQPWTPAVTLPHRRNGLSARRMAVLSTCPEPSLCRQVHRELLRNVLLDLTPLIAATACHQRNDVERYSRSIEGHHQNPLGEKKRLP